MNKPFVKMFEICTGYYFYDIGKNCIMAVNRGVYRYIQELCKYGYEVFEDKYKDNQDVDYLTIKRLRQKNYLSNNKPVEIYHPYTDFAEEYVNSNLNNLILQVTQMCNFNCAYCPYAGNGKFDRGHYNKAMPWDIAQRAVDLLIKNSRNSKELSIGFYGGEPLLEYQLIQKVVRYSKEKAGIKNLQFGMTTNGYMITDEMVDFFKKYGFSITISFDGPQHIHDKNRTLGANGKGTFQQVYKNMKKMKEKGLSFGINAVWDTEEAFDQVTNFFDSDPLFSGINMTLNQVMTGRIDTGYSVSAESKYSEDVFVVKAYLNYLGLYKQLTQKEKDYAIEAYENTARLLKEQEKMPRQFHHGGPCMPGQLKLFVDIYGDFFPCERISGKSKVMRIGSVDSGFDMVQIKKILNIGKITEQECKECWAMHLCSICSMWADNDENAFCKKIKLNRCNYTRALASKDIKDYIIITEIKNMLKEKNVINYKV